MSTTAMRLFNQRFLCEVKELTYRTIADITHHGVPSSGDAALDAAIAASWFPIYLTPVMCATMYHDGEWVMIKNKADIEAIYRLIDRHLDDWRLVLDENIFFTPIVPVEDLIVLDTFAQALLKSSKGFTEPMTARPDRLAAFSLGNGGVNQPHYNSRLGELKRFRKTTAAESVATNPELKSTAIAKLYWEREPL